MLLNVVNINKLGLSEDHLEIIRGIHGLGDDGVVYAKCNLLEHKMLDLSDAEFGAIKALRRALEFEGIVLPLSKQEILDFHVILWDSPFSK